MNNEFNNENMNQFQNNNMNNEYSNNYNNLNNMNDNWKKVLIIILVIISLFLTALTIYVVVDKKATTTNNKENIKEENNDNNIPEKDYAKLQQKVLDEYYLKTTDIIDKHIIEYEYSSIANNEISYNEFKKNYSVRNIIASLESIGSVGGSSSHVEDEYDKNGVKYPDYCGNYGNSCVENIAKDFGLTVDEINKMDKSVWSTTGGQYSFYMYDAKQVKDKYLDIYNDLFNSSFSFSFLGLVCSYDKNLDKIITGNYGGTAGGYVREIIDAKTEENLYKVKFVEGFFEPDFDEKGKHVLVIDSKTRINSIENQSKALKENKDKLPNYEVVFEKTDTGYKYKSIKKIENNKLNYEIKTNGANKELYVNNKKVNGVKANSELGSIEVKEFNDLLIVDEQNPGPSRKLFVVDKNGNANEIDYKVSTYNNEFINSIDSYRVEGNNLYIKVNRQWGNGYIDWYCRYEDKNEVAEYEVKYEYSNGKLENKQVLNEVTIANKYKNESCMNSTKVCEGNKDAVYHGEYNEKKGEFTYNINTTLTLNADGTFFQDYKNSEPIQGTYTLSNNKLTISHCPSVGSCDEKLTSTHDVSSDCSIINWGSYNLNLK